MAYTFTVELCSHMTWKAKCLETGDMVYWDNPYHALKLTVLNATDIWLGSLPVPLHGNGIIHLAPRSHYVWN